MKNKFAHVIGVCIVKVLLAIALLIIAVFGLVMVTIKIVSSYLADITESATDNLVKKVKA